MPTRLEKAAKAKRESKYVEFKEGLDTSSRQAWCEVLKDLVAIANSGGGVIVVGVDNRGRPVGADTGPVLALDPAQIADRLHRYTDTHFSDFEIRPVSKGNQVVAAIVVGPAGIPIVFTKPGTYAVGSKQKTAFGQGTVYFRHGAKSEPGSREDLRGALDRQLERIRKQWMSGVRKVVKAPIGSAVQVLPSVIRDSDSPEAVPIRVTQDPSARAYRVVDPDATHPFRQTELIREVRRGLPRGVRFNRFDVLTIRRVYGIDESEEYCHQPKFGSPQYSRAFVSWILEHYRDDSMFFEKTRALYRSRS